MIFDWTIVLHYASIVERKALEVLELAKVNPLEMVVAAQGILILYLILRKRLKPLNKKTLQVKAYRFKTKKFKGT